METKRNLKYYIAPPISIPTIVGLVITLVGIVLALIMPSKIPGIAVIVLGLLTVMFTTGGKSNDTDIEFQARALTSDLQENAMKKFEVYEKHFLKMLKPINLRGYDFTAKEEPFYYKKGKDGVNRTNYFMGCNLIFTSEKMFVFGRRFSLTDETIDGDFMGSYFFNELDRAEIEEGIYETKKGDRTIEIKYYVFRILKADGTKALEMCVDYGADIDKYAEQISRAIVTRQKELAKRAEEAAQRRAEFRARVEAEKAADAAAAAEGNE